MEMSSVRLNSKQIADECNFINNFEMSSLEFDTLDEFTAEQYFQKDLSSGSYTSFLTMDQETSINNNTTIEISDSFEPPAKQIKTDNNTWNSSPNKHVSAKSSSSSSSQLISFANFSSGPSEPQGSCGDLVSPVAVPKDEIYEELRQTYSDLYGSFGNNYALKSGQGTKRSISTMARTPSHAQDHVIAERKRRERLTERFIALSAIVPDLKKLDKASVLGDAIKYLKQLQERVKLLEEELKKKKKSEESVVSLNSSQRHTSDGSSSCDESSGGSLNTALPGIEARVSEKNVLIRIHCEKQKGFVSKLLSEIEKLHLTVINSSVLPFGNYAMDITIVAQMEAESSLTVKGLVRNLRSALK